MTASNQFPGISPDRIRQDPRPDTATEADQIRICGERLCELVDGVLIDKVATVKDSAVDAAVGGKIRCFLKHHDLSIMSSLAFMAELPCECETFSARILESRANAIAKSAWTPVL